MPHTDFPHLFLSLPQQNEQKKSQKLWKMCKILYIIMVYLFRLPACGILQLVALAFSCFSPAACQLPFIYELFRIFVTSAGCLVAIVITSVFVLHFARVFGECNYASDLAFNLFHIPRCLNITSCNLCN